MHLAFAKITDQIALKDILFDCGKYNEVQEKADIIDISNFEKKLTSNFMQKQPFKNNFQENVLKDLENKLNLNLS